MTDPVMPDPLDSFHVEIDIKHERADVILERPPLNVIAMPQRRSRPTVMARYLIQDHRFLESFLTLLDAALASANLTEAARLP
jgi:hypothetical protein